MTLWAEVIAAKARVMNARNMFGRIGGWTVDERRERVRHKATVGLETLSTEKRSARLKKLRQSLEYKKSEDIRSCWFVQ